MGLKTAPICVEDVGKLKQTYGTVRILEQLRQGTNVARVGPRAIYDGSKCESCRKSKEIVSFYTEKDIWLKFIYVYMNTCIYVYIYAYIRICTYIYICVYIYRNIYTYIYIYVFPSLYFVNLSSWICQPGFLFEMFYST